MSRQLLAQGHLASQVNPCACQERSGRNAFLQRIDLWLFLILLVCYIYFFPRWADWNQNSRLDLVLAVVDQGTLCIDKYYQNTGDYALFEGHHYSDKAPGLSFLAIPVYAAFKPVLRSGPVQRLTARLAEGQASVDTLQEGDETPPADKVYFAVVLCLVTFAVVSVPSALLGVLLYHLLGQLTSSQSWRIATVLLYGLGTSAFPYSGSFFGHQLVAFLLYGAFYLSLLIRQHRLDARWAVLMGLMLGYALITEYPTALIAVAIFFYACLALRYWRPIVGLIAGGLPPGVLLAAYNLAIFHTPLPVGYTYSELYTEQHSTGFFSLTFPHADALWGITFSSYRGLFYLSPVLLLAIPGFVAWWQSRRLRGEWAVCLWAVLSIILFNSSSVMWQGGFAVGPRYVLPMLPFLATAMGAFAEKWGARTWARALTGVLCVWSLLAVWAESIGGQSFPDWTLSPLFNYSLPRLMGGNIARNWGMILGFRGWASLWPLVALLVTSMIGLINELYRRQQIPTVERSPVV